VVLKESVDVNSLGAVDTPRSHSKNQLSRSAHEFASPTPPQKEMRTPRVPQAPATPVVVPPTPSPSSSSSNEVFYDAEDTDNMPSKRRSIYRSPGTSSSPDLATLARRAKERGTVVPAKLVQSQKEKRPTQPPPPPLPTTSNGNGHARASPAASSTLRGSTRPRSSTSGAAGSGCPPPPKLSITPAPCRSSARSGKDPTSPNGSDWVMPSPRSRTSSKAGSDKVRGFLLAPCAQVPFCLFTETQFSPPGVEKLRQG